MADLLITRSVLRNGAPADADAAPVLRDPTGTYGMRRDDMGAILVAAGAALTRTGVGRYERLVVGLVPGVAYTYWRETTVDGVTTRREGHYTAPAAVAGLPTYLDVAAARGYAAQLHGLQAIVDATDANLLKALTGATARVDAAYRWQGRKVDGAQPLEFPRVDQDGTYVVADTNGVPAVPIKIKVAVAFEANSILAGRRDATIAAQHDGLASQAIGDASESYVAPVKGNGVPILCKEADSQVSAYRLRSGRLA